MTPFGAGGIEDLGFAAAFCTTAAFVPQLVRVVRLRSARDISLPTFLMFSVGVFLWLLYGIYTGSKPVIASNAVTLVLSVSILVLKLKYDRRTMQELKPREFRK
jgi:MtN3 and saliva related transmembrane protein